MSLSTQLMHNSPVMKPHFNSLNPDFYDEPDEPYFPHHKYLSFKLKIHDLFTNKRMKEIILVVKMMCLHLRSGTRLTLSALRLLVSPIRLVSAAVWQTIQKKVVANYGMLEQFVSTVTDIVPELLTTRQKVQLTLGLRACVRRRSSHLLAATNIDHKI